MAGEDIKREIQRLPSGLANVLGLFGGILPNELAKENMGVLDLLQFYGLSQRAVLGAQNAALAPGAILTCQLPSTWCVLFGASFAIAANAAITALGASIAVNRGTPSGPAYNSIEFPQFGVGGGTHTLCFQPPYPMLLPPNSTVAGGVDILGGAATCAGAIVVEFGQFG